MMKSMDLTVGDALYLYTICSILPDSSDCLPYKGSLFSWLCIEPPKHAWRRPTIQHNLGRVVRRRSFSVCDAFGCNNFHNGLRVPTTSFIYDKQSSAIAEC